MPLYQYRCKECGQELEARQKFSDAPLELCPNCGANQGLYRVVQAAGIVFKGSGFYINDSRGSKDSLTSSSKKDEKNGSKPESSSSDSSSKSDGATSSSSSSPSASSPAAD